MKNNNKIIIGVMAGVVILIIVVITPGLLNPVQASLGNYAVPVRCLPLGGQRILVDSSDFFRCYAADGTRFTDNAQRVPEGYYFIVTDVVITPYQAGSHQDGFYELVLYDSYGASYRRYSLFFRGMTLGTTHNQFIAPYLVLVGGDRLEAYNLPHTSYALRVNISGFLVRNISYLPLISK